MRLSPDLDLGFRAAASHGQHGRAALPPRHHIPLVRAKKKRETIAPKSCCKLHDQSHQTHPSNSCFPNAQKKGPINSRETGAPSPPLTETNTARVEPSPLNYDAHKENRAYHTSTTAPDTKPRYVDASVAHHSEPPYGTEPPTNTARALSRNRTRPPADNASLSKFSPMFHWLLESPVRSSSSEETVRTNVYT